MRHLLFLSVALAALGIAVGLSSGESAKTQPAETTRPASIAAKYPGDKGIAKDPAVILHEDFEDKTRTFDKKRWTSISNKAGALKLVREAKNVHSGRQALQITATMGKNSGGHLFRRFQTGHETMYARFCVKFAADCDYIHHFVHMGAELPAYRWPTGGAGLLPAGDKKFSVGIEPTGFRKKCPPPGGWHFYCYWWKMRRCGDGKYWGQGFSKKPYAVPKRGKWYCIECMTKCNTPGKPDGQVALWIDGVKLAHHKNINWRSSKKLKLNAFWLMLYVTKYSAKTNKVNTVWFDDVVVATEYIGPPAPARLSAKKKKESASMITINARDNGYRGIWYALVPYPGEYAYCYYSGGLGTYCAKHRPFGVYCDKARKTFFCYGGTTADSHTKLLHMVSYYDHKTGMVPRPTILRDKKTHDAHDNPVISVDEKGHIWIFSTSHGRERPAYIHRSKKPYDIDEFELIKATRIKDSKEVPMTNFSYMQPWYVPGKGFFAFFTRYRAPANRTIFFMSSSDGVKWSKWVRLAAISEGHYQISALSASGKKAGTAFNFHPKKKGADWQGSNWRTNLYYIETSDCGKTWRTADGKKPALPLTEVKNPALIHDYQAEGLNVYLKDIGFDRKAMPVILFVTSKGPNVGPENGPRTWTTARWTGKNWLIRPAMTSDNNYDTGSLYIEDDGTWRIIGPTETGPQPYNPGGEMTAWISKDLGKTWKKVKQITNKSERNHSYARRPLNAHPDFYAIWADGHGRKPSESALYFCDKKGNVKMLPQKMKGDFAKPETVSGE